MIDDYIKEDNPVKFIDIFVDSLDIKQINFKYAETKETGKKPYNLRDMLKLYLYGYLSRIRSSRKLEKETHRNVELMWLLRKLTPGFKTIADFKKDNKHAIRQVYKEFIFLCKNLDLFGSEFIAIDVSKFKAVNSKKRNFNEKKLKRKIKDIENKIEEYLQELDENDRKEKEISNIDAKKLRKKIEEFKKRKQEYKKFLDQIKESGETQVSLTDRDARTVDEKHKLILDYEVTNDVKDGEHLSEMAKRAKEILEVEEFEVLADKGYYNSEKTMCEIASPCYKNLLKIKGEINYEYKKQSYNNKHYFGC